MKISWVLGQEITEDLDLDLISSIAPSWGSWKTWKKYKTDNCICANADDAEKLIQRAFHALCNFYMMRDDFLHVGRPQGVKLFDGNFKNNTVTNKDDIVTLNLVVPENDIVLMSGFNLSPLDESDPLSLLIREEYYFNLNELMKEYENVQFVLVDYKHEMAQWAKDLPNLNVDTIASVRTLLD